MWLKYILAFTDHPLHILQHDLQIRNSLILFFQIGLKGDDVLLNILIQIVDCRPVQAHSPPYVDILYIRHEEGELLLEIL